MSVTYNDTDGHVNIQFREKLTEAQRERFSDEFGPDSEGCYDGGSSSVNFTEDGHGVKIYLSAWTGSPEFGSLSYTLEGLREELGLYVEDGSFSYEETYEFRERVEVTMENGKFSWEDVSW